MPSFTVHAPPPRRDETAADPERFAFVRDGFHFWAFLFGPLWLLRYRLWLALIIFVVLYVALEFGLAAIRAPSTVQFLVTLLVGILMGCEASSIRRWTLTRRGWTALGFVVAENQEMAERRFFANWTERSHAAAAVNTPPSAPQYATPVRRGPPSNADVLGLFPEPGASR